MVNITVKCLWVVHWIGWFIWKKLFQPINHFHWIISGVSKANPIVYQWFNFHVHVFKNRKLVPFQCFNCGICKSIYRHLFILFKYILIFITTIIANPITIFLVDVHVYFRIIRIVLQFKQYFNHSLLHQYPSADPLTLMEKTRWTNLAQEVALHSKTHFTPAISHGTAVYQVAFILLEVAP